MCHFRIHSEDLGSVLVGMTPPRSPSIWYGVTELKLKTAVAKSSIWSSFSSSTCNRGPLVSCLPAQKGSSLVLDCSRVSHTTWISKLSRRLLLIDGCLIIVGIGGYSKDAYSVILLRLLF